MSFGQARSSDLVESVELIKSVERDPDIVGRWDPYLEFSTVKPPVIVETSLLLQCRRCQVLFFHTFFPHYSIHSEMSAISLS